METKELYMPHISASSPEGFQKMYDMVKTLPQSIIDQIESVRSGIVGLELTYKDQWSNEGGKFLILPPRQITDMGDYIAIYCNDFFFKVAGRNYENAKKNYYVVDINGNKL